LQQLRPATAGKEIRDEHVLAWWQILCQLEYTTSGRHRMHVSEVFEPPIDDEEMQQPLVDRGECRHRAEVSRIA